MTRVALSFGCLLLAAPVSGQDIPISVSTAGVQANGLSTSPAISGDGRYVVFASEATNLVADDTNARADIFLRDRDTDADGVFDEPGAVATTRLNLGPGGAQANDASFSPVVTPDGRYVCFSSLATNLAATPVPAAVYQIYRLDRTTGAIVVVSANDAGVPGDLHSYQAAISDSGDTVAFSSEASTLVPGPQTTTAGIFLRDIAASRTTRLTPPGPFSLAAYTNPSISSDGRRVAYQIRSPPLVPSAVALFDRQTGTTRELMKSALVALAAGGGHAILSAEGTLRVPVDLGPDTFDRLNIITGPDGAVAVSHDGRYVLTYVSGVLDVDLNRAVPIGIVQIGYGAFDRVGRWLAIGVGQILVVDLPDRLDADDDSMADSWEQFFGQSDPNADPDGDGVTNAQEHAAGSHPNGQVRRFLAEGATGSFFATDIALANPDVTQAATVVLTFDTGDGRRFHRPVALPPGRSEVIHAGAVPGLEAADFASTIESNLPVAVSRTMTWDTQPGHVANRGYGAHMEVAAAAPASTWFFAEGSTVLGFDLFYLLQNPQATTTHATVRFLLPSGTVVTRTYDLAPASRTTIYVNQVAGLDETDVSGDITTDAPIVAERAMYRSLPGQPFALGHGATGVTAAAPRWFLAEGATGPFFDLYVLVANPTSTDAVVDVQYAKPDGSAVTRQYLVGANSRFSVFVDGIPGLENTPVATTATSTNSVPIVVERAMYWPGGFFDYYEGHASAGSTTTARHWAIGGGEYGGRYDSRTFVLIANTGAAVTPVTVTMQSRGLEIANAPLSLILPPNSRTTVEIIPQFGLRTFGIAVQGALQTSTDLVVEVAVYRTIGGVTWSAGANALATPLP